MRTGLSATLTGISAVLYSSQIGVVCSSSCGWKISADVVWCESEPTRYFSSTRKRMSPARKTEWSNERERRGRLGTVFAGPCIAVHGFDPLFTDHFSSSHWPVLTSTGLDCADFYLLAQRSTLCIDWHPCVRESNFWALWIIYSCGSRKQRGVVYCCRPLHCVPVTGCVQYMRHRSTSHRRRSSDRGG